MRLRLGCVEPDLCNFDLYGSDLFSSLQHSAFKALHFDRITLQTLIIAYPNNNLRRLRCLVENLKVNYKIFKNWTKKLSFTFRPINEIGISIIKNPLKIVIFIIYLPGSMIKCYMLVITKRSNLLLYFSLMPSLRSTSRRSRRTCWSRSAWEKWGRLTSPGWQGSASKSRLF